MSLFCRSLIKVALLGHLFSSNRRRYFDTPVGILLSPGLSSKGRVRSYYFTNRFLFLYEFQSSRKWRLCRAMLAVICGCTRSYDVIFDVIEALLSVKNDWRFSHNLSKSYERSLNKNNPLHSKKVSNGWTNDKYCISSTNIFDRYFGLLCMLYVAIC